MPEEINIGDKFECLDPHYSKIFRMFTVKEISGSGRIFIGSMEFADGRVDNSQYCIHSLDLLDNYHFTRYNEKLTKDRIGHILINKIRNDRQLKST